MNSLAPEPSHANVSKRELRNLARRLATADRLELRAVGRGLDKVLAGEVYTRAHHDGNDYDPARCSMCEPALRLVYVIGIALPDADPEGLGVTLGGLVGLDAEGIAMALGDARAESCPPDVTRRWLAMVDEQDDTLMSVRAGLEPGWTKTGHHWGRSYGPDECDADGRWNAWPPNAPAVDAFIREIKQSHAAECDRFWREHGRFAEPELLAEIRYGSDPRRMRAAKRASLRKGMDLSCLIK